MMENRRPRRRPRICIALPSTNYTPHSTYVRTVIPLLPYLQEDFDITLAYRKILNDQTAEHIKHQYLTILKEDTKFPGERENFSRYTAPYTYQQLRQYQTQIKTFAQAHASDFDLFIERQWSWLGAMSQAFTDEGVQTALIPEAWFEPRLPPWQKPIQRLYGWRFHQVRRRRQKLWAQQVNGIIAETEEMADLLCEENYIPSCTPMLVASNGIDPACFQPRPKQQCRQSLGISKDAFVITYIGSLNRYIQEPGPLIEAVGRVGADDLTVYFVGDGAKRAELETLSQSTGAATVFVGQQPQTELASYIGAADLCVAPYNFSLYYKRRFTSASLKIPEYLACHRLVIAPDCSRTRRLTDNGKYGFFVDNTVEAYEHFLTQRPSKSEIQAKQDQLTHALESGTLREKGIVLHWSDIADIYKTAFQQFLTRTAP